MSSKENPIQSTLQAKVFDFALSELVFQNRESFQPLWTVDSWVKFLIWIALNCGLSGEKESLEVFADAMGRPLTIRMRNLFYERILDDLSLKVIADPADSQVLIMPLKLDGKITLDMARQALDFVGLSHRVVLSNSNWQILDAMIAIPWQSSK